MIPSFGADLARIPVPSGRFDVRRIGAVTTFTVADVAKRMIALRLYWNGGAAAETAGECGAGLVALRALLRSPSRTPGVLPVIEELEALGVTAEAQVAETSWHVDLRGPQPSIGPAVRLVADSLMRGGPVQSSVTASVNQILDMQRRRRHNLAALVEERFRMARASPGGPLARPLEGTEESLRSLQGEKVAAALADLHRSRPRLVVVGGDIAADVAELGDVLAGPFRPDTPPSVAELFAERPPAQISVDSQLNEQGYLLWGTVYPGASPEDYSFLEIATRMIGGWTGSRWHGLFRDELAYTYGLRHHVSALVVGSRLVCSARIGMAVPPAVVGECAERMVADAASIDWAKADPDEIRATAAQLLRVESSRYLSSRSLMTYLAPFAAGGPTATFAAGRVYALRHLDTDRFRGRVAELLATTTLART